MRTNWRARAAALGCLLALFAGAAAAQRGRTAAPALPPLSMTCQHHPDVIESAPGLCPICKLPLVPVRLAPAWTCPVHPATIADTNGTCPICRRQLVPVTVSLTWTCPGSSEEHVTPGVCANGAPMTLRRSLRPHGDHNPRHGGQFFMAGDSWHHVEGVHPQQGVFRLFVYDDFGRPLASDRLKAVQARVVTRERFDPQSRTYIEERSSPLRPAANSAYLEAKIDRAAFPAEMTAKIRFAREGQEYRFDFTFLAVTPPDRAPVTTSSSRVAGAGSAPAPSKPAAPAPVASARTAEPDAPDAGAAPAPDPALTAVPIPETMSGILEQLRTRNEHVRSLIARGDFSSVWFPAFAAKDLAIALEPHLAHLDGAKREAASTALQRIVRFAWLLDTHGDRGNRQQLLDAHAAFSAAVREVEAAFGAP